MLWEINNSIIYDSILMKIICYDQKQPLNNCRSFEVRSFLNCFHFSVNLLWVMVCNYIFSKQHCRSKRTQHLRRLAVTQIHLDSFPLFKTPSYRFEICRWVVVMVQIPRFYFPSAALWMQNIVTSNHMEEKKKKSSKVETAAPREVFHFGLCARL